MATDQSIEELLAAADEALAEAGFRTGDFSTARELAEQAEAGARTGDAVSHARALNCLGMVAHYENITRLMRGTKPGTADIDSEEKLFRQALRRWQEAAEQAAGKRDGAAAAQAASAAGERAQADAEPEAGQTDAEPEARADEPEAEGDAQPEAGATPESAEATQAAVTTAAGTAQSLFGLGLVFQVLHSDFMTAMPYFWQALELVSKPDAAADLYLRSEVHRHVGFYFLVEDAQPSEAVRHLQLSLDLREELADPRRVPSGLQALGQAELSAGNRDRAITLLSRALDEARAAGLLQERIEAVERDLREASGTGESSSTPESGPAPESGATAESGATPESGAAAEAGNADEPSEDDSAPGK